MVGFDYRDERGDRSSTGLVRRSGTTLPFLLDREAGRWRLDLSLWLHDLHQNVTAFHEGCAIRSPMSSARRCYAPRTCGSGCRAIPDEIGGFEIYTAVIEDGVGTPEQFWDWHGPRAGLPKSTRRGCVAVRPTESGAQRKPQVAGFAEDATQREREPWLSAAAKIGNLIR